MRSNDVLEYWFGHIPGRKLLRGQSRQIVKRLPVWAGKWGNLVWRVDERLRSEFGEDLLRAGRGEYDNWADDAIGRFALILLLDQFARNIHRGKPEAYAHDARSLSLALEALDQGEDMLVYPLARSFYYLPLVHQELDVYQERAVAAYSEAIREAGVFERTILYAEYVSARRHRSIIRRFGRFPHRNKVLGRSSTREERRFLRQPFSHF